MKTTTKAVLAELQKLAKSNRGLLRPVTVVSAAEDEASPLHSKFEWDDTLAAAKHRLWQARQLIEQFWTVDAASDEPIHMFLSLQSDRTARKGYRSSAFVMNSSEHRQEWLEQAVGELATWRKTFGSLTELKSVNASIGRMLMKYQPAQERKAG